jgi:hypothetical protein
MKLSSTVQKIGNACFCNCSNLIKINIPKNVSEIGEYCFDNTKLFSHEGKIDIKEGSKLIGKESLKIHIGISKNK